MKLKDKLKIHSNTSHTLPTALESEMYVIGSTMLLKGAVQSIFEHLRHWHFYFDKNKVIWKAISRLIKKDKAITKELLFAELYKKAFFEGKIDAGYLQECINACGVGIVTVSKSALVSHKEEVIETWSRRQMIDLGHTVQYWGFLPGGHCTKQFATFERRKERIEELYQNAIKGGDDCPPYNPNDPVEMEDFTLSLDMDGKNYGLAEQGNIVAVSGGTGSRKTVVLTGIIASSFVERSFIGFNQANRGAILFFDTEQPIKTFKHVQRRLWHMCNRQNVGTRYKAWPLRAKSPKERILKISKEIRKWQGKISIIVIDGILDLVTSMNDIEECTAAIQALMRWTEETGATVLCVLHDVRSSNKMGGHLGSLLERKIDVEINVNIADDPLYSELKFRKTRASVRPRSFLFTQSDNENTRGWPVIANTVEQMPNNATGTNGVYEDDVPF